jgi:CRISPR/Cas system CSM-associated protein Csm3 (group 7 of RAMP superfamily)
MPNHPLNDAMAPRTLAARWTIRGTLTLETALHLGGEGGERVDSPVLRDPREGLPLLPGTTLAGALRNALADRRAGYGKKEPQEIAKLFGGARGVDDGSQSPLIVFDAIGALPKDHGVEVRDGVAILPATGVAEDGKKYDYEVLPAETRFPVRVDLLVPGADQTDEKTLVGLLVAALDALPGSALGAKRSRGLGRMGAKWAAKRFALDSAEGWLEWILSNHELPFAGEPSHPSAHEAIEAAAPASMKPFPLAIDVRKRVVLDLDLKVDHDLLVRSPGTTPDAPDVSHLLSGGAPILPGTSLAGVMRAQALRIAGLVRDKQQDGQHWVDRLFGPRFEGQRPPAGVQPRASRLRIGEARLEKSRSQRQTRIAIDRFTQGVVDGALFDEQTEVGGEVKTCLELRDPQKGELGLVLLVLKDLLDGLLPVGGSSSVGRGVLGGTAMVRWFEGDGSASCMATVKPRETPSGQGSAKIDEEIRAFHKAASLRRDSHDRA